MKTIVTLLVLVFAVGCGDNLIPVYPQLPCQDQATTIVWNDTYGRTDQPPPVQWLSGAELDCDNGTKFLDHTDNPPTCVDGLYWPDMPEKVQAAVYPTFWQSAFAAELCHSHWDRTTGDPDTAHGGDCFVQGGLVFQAETALRIAEETGTLCPSTITGCGATGRDRCPEP